MERDDDIKGEGKSYDFGARMYNNRLGRWWSLDPKSQSQPQWSAYKSMNCNPLIFVDPNGEREYLTIVIRDSDGHEIIIQKQVSYNIMAGKPYEEYLGGSSHQKVDYYDFERVVYVDINNSNGESTIRTEINLLDNHQKRDTDWRIPFQELRSGHVKTKYSDWFSDIEKGWEGDGSSQKSGFHLVSGSGGSSPTKVKATEGSGQNINIDYLANALGGIAKSLKLPKVTEGVDAVVSAVREFRDSDFGNSESPRGPSWECMNDGCNHTTNDSTKSMQENRNHNLKRIE